MCLQAMASFITFHGSINTELKEVFPLPFSAKETDISPLLLFTNRIEIIVGYAHQDLKFLGNHERPNASTYFS